MAELFYFTILPALIVTALAAIYMAWHEREDIKGFWRNRKKIWKQLLDVVKERRDGRK